MKKHILIVALLLASRAFSQSFTQNNEPEIGTNVSMYVADSLTSNNANLKGSNVTWDATNLVIKDTTKRLSIKVETPANTTYGSTYVGSNKAITIENFITSYYSSTSQERSSVGYFFTSEDLGDVKAVFTSNPQITHTYPFAVTNSKTDDLSGKIYYTFNSIPVSPSATGKSIAEVDGLGTFKVDAAKSITNVLRYHIFDSTQAVLSVPGLGTTQIILKRDQYEYYDLATSNLPIYTHTNLKAFAPLISPDPLVDKTVVLAKYKADKNATPPDNTASLENVTSNNFVIFPNPAKENLSILGLTEKATIHVIDQSGKVIKDIISTQGQESFDLKGIENGIYFISIETNSLKEVQKFEKN
jgi:hypothetical protein